MDLQQIWELSQKLLEEGRSREDVEARVMELTQQATGERMGLRMLEFRVGQTGSQKFARDPLGSSLTALLAIPDVVRAAPKIALQAVLALPRIPQAIVDRLAERGTKGIVEDAEKVAQFFVDDLAEFGVGGFADPSFIGRVGKVAGKADDAVKLLGKAERAAGDRRAIEAGFTPEFREAKARDAIPVVERRAGQERRLKEGQALDRKITDEDPTAGIFERRTKRIMQEFNMSRKDAEVLAGSGMAPRSPSAQAMNPSSNVSESILALTDEFHGSTVDPRTGQSLVGNDLWAVSNGKKTERLFDKRPTPSEVDAFILEHQKILDADPELHVGTWNDAARPGQESMDHGKWEINLTRTFRRQDDARDFALAQKQTGYMNLADESFETIRPNDALANTRKRAELDAAFPERVQRRAERAKIEEMAELARNQQGEGGVGNSLPGLIALLIGEGIMDSAEGRELIGQLADEAGFPGLGPAFDLDPSGTVDYLQLFQERPDVSEDDLRRFGEVRGIGKAPDLIRTLRGSAADPEPAGIRRSGKSVGVRSPPASLVPAPPVEGPIF